MNTALFRCQSALIDYIIAATSTQEFRQGDVVTRQNPIGNGYILFQQTEFFLPEFWLFSYFDSFYIVHKN